MQTIHAALLPMVDVYGQVLMPMAPCARKQRSVHPLVSWDPEKFSAYEAL